MTDKQINIVETLAEQCKNCTLYEGDTVSLNISIFDRQLKGVCFNNNIYFSVDELNYIMQKLISKEQECEGLRYEIGSLENDRDILQEKLDQLKAENKHLNDLLNQALKELEKTRETLTEIKEIAGKAREDLYTCESIFYADDDLREILQKISECEVE